MCLLITILIIGLIAFYFLLLEDTKKPTNFPPGPRWLPVVGNLLELKKLAKTLGGQHLALTELSKIYHTNVLGLKLGNDYVVAVFSYNIVRQVLIGEEYEGRPDNFFIRLRCMGTRRGVTCTDGDVWSIQRNFLVRHLRDLGFGKTSMELMVKNEVQSILANLKQTNHVHIGKTLAPVVINILWTLITGNQLNSKHSQLDRLLDLFELRSKAFDMSGGILAQFPWLRFIVPEWSGYNLIQNINKQLNDLFMATIKEHQTNWHVNRNDDLIYAYITEMKQNNNNIFDYGHLVMICLDLFIAGAQTTSNTLNFAFLMMILHPQIQEQIHQELDQCLSDNNLAYSDRNKLPYTEAVLLEVERYHGVAPIIGPRRVLRDTVLDGYHIPKDTTVLISLYSVLNDKDYWKDPEVFRPERFLDSCGKLLMHDRLIPFGLGKRRCLGEILAKTCIFMLFVEIMRKFKIMLKPDSKMPTGKPLPGITLSPEPYHVQFLER